ncbi:response regulator [Bradyrhizobium sp. 187]|jgi:DNA-binding response OmpR family regulator|nr:response regulator [Bradyrhizobium sp. 187]
MHLSNSQDSAERPTILLVEDEDLLREMLEETLIEAGYGVVSAASGEAATNLLSRPPLPRALVADINLGRARMDGWELARIARQNDPGCVILYVSGDSAHRWAANGVPRSVLLAKPFAPAQLVEEISSLLLRCGAAPR